jgi:hypothetical protein
MVTCREKGNSAYSGAVEAGISKGEADQYPKLKDRVLYNEVGFLGQAILYCRTYSKVFRVTYGASGAVTVQGVKVRIPEYDLGLCIRVELQISITSFKGPLDGMVVVAVRQSPSRIRCSEQGRFKRIRVFGY